MFCSNCGKPITIGAKFCASCGTPVPQLDSQPVQEAEEAPVYEAPAEEAPVYEAPVEEAPVYEAPVEEAPVYEAPVEETPVYEAPAEEAPVYEAPVQEAPVYEAPVQEAPVYEAPVQEKPVQPAEYNYQQNTPVQNVVPAADDQTNSKASKALIFGILSLVFAEGLLPILGIIFGAVAKSNVKAVLQANGILSGKSKAGNITGTIGLILGILNSVCVVLILIFFIVIVILLTMQGLSIEDLPYYFY